MLDESPVFASFLHNFTYILKFIVSTQINKTFVTFQLHFLSIGVTIKVTKAMTGIESCP
jgi:hypothetical protein